MILIYNTIINEKARNNFTANIAARITFGKPFNVLHLQDDLPELKQFSHLILTGSELSASQGSAWDKKIITVIKSFLQENKPILGICHGHQMIARTIAGDKACRRAAEPEFGWKQMQIATNSLFKGITHTVFLESRYDEVFDLPADFKIIAWNDKAAVQAFQYKNLPVWGVQFHPEMLLEDGTAMVEDHLLQNPDERIYWADELQYPENVSQSLNIFRNFYQSL